jgi:hypothetical protein
MAAYTWDEMTDILLACGAADGNGRMAQRLYQERFPNRRLPHHSTFASTNRRLRETGSLNVNRHDFGWVRTVRTLRFEEAVLNVVADTPSTNTRRVGHAMHASHTGRASAAASPVSSARSSGKGPSGLPQATGV